MKKIYPDDGDPDAVPGVQPNTEGAGDVPSTTLEVDGEVFALSPNECRGTNYTWLSGPNPGYGFSAGPTLNESVDEHIANIRDFLAAIDPTTGYIED